MKIHTLLLAALLTAAAGVSAQNDPYNGTWTRHVAPGGAAQPTQVLTFKVVGDEETYTSDMMSAEGRHQVTHYRAKYDGKEYPSQTVITERDGKSQTRNDTVILKKIDNFKRERHWKQGGRLVTILRRTVSPDGKTLTSQQVAVDENGQEHPAAALLVYDKK